ncbi:hypothetical protein V5F59_11020 [Xanthobacter autotrophicus DSM 431]|uniref:hypothetical protein n=1 Tax=Xanthobacter nonsaccharivorans TaxID=3119912 RepID=UPI0037280A2F
MRRLLTAAVLAVALTAAAIASPARAADVTFPRGSAIGLVPPPGMSESQAFTGFEDLGHTAALVIAEMPAEAFDPIEAGFTSSALASKGIELEKREPFELKGGKGVLFTARQTVGSATFRKWVLLAGNDAMTALVTMQVPEGEIAAYPDAVVRAALATLTFRSVQNQVDALPFVMGNLAGFRPIRAIAGNTLLLTDGPKDVVDGAEQPIFVVSIGSGAPREDDRRQFAIRALSTLPGVKEMRLERAEPLRISGQPGFEVMATAADAKTGQPVKIVQWLRFGPTAYVRMVGVTKLDAFPDLYDRLRALRDGLESR